MERVYRIICSNAPETSNSSHYPDEEHLAETPIRNLFVLATNYNHLDGLLPPLLLLLLISSTLFCISIIE